MLKLFKREAAPVEAPKVDTEALEHQAFALWLERQPEHRKEIYLNLAMSYGFRATSAPAETERSEEHV